MILEDIPKKPIFNVPEGYFEQLPGKIQQRIDAGSNKEVPVFARLRLQYALPALVLLVIVAWLFRTTPATDAESILASVETEDMIAYLNSSELTTEEVLDEVQFNPLDIEDIEMEVYQLQLEDDIFDDLVQQSQGDSLL